MKLKHGQPDLTNLMRIRAALLADLGKTRPPSSNYRTCTRHPGDSLTMLQMGMLYTGMKQYEKGRKSSRRSWRTIPTT